MVLVPLLLAAAAAGYMVSRQLARDTPHAAAAPPQLQSGTALPRPRALPEFQLTDHGGAPFGNARLAGQPSLLFFGFTHCPDICPTTLVMLTQLVRDEALSGLQPVFITVDPERDDARALAQYVNAFGNRIIGLRGEEAELAPLLQGLGVAHGRIPLPGGGYTVDHSAGLYFLDERGQWTALFTPPFDLAKLRADLNTLVAGGS